MKPYFETQSGVLYHGDCLRVIESIEDRSVDLICTDPPFNFRAGNMKGKGLHARKYFSCIKKIEQSFGHAFNPIKYLKKFNRVIKKPNAYYFCSKDSVETYLRYARLNGLSSNILTWHKNNPIPCYNNVHIPDTEYIIFMRGRGAYFAKGLNRDDYRKTTTSPRFTIPGHPTPKPASIMEWLIKISCPRGGLVLDPFAGTCATAIACEHLCMRWVCIEKDERFCEVAAKRIVRETRQVIFGR
jgi:DNA modification methylase